MKTKIFSLLLLTTLLCRLAFCGEIHDATRDGDLAKVKALLKDNPDLVFSKDDAGRTPLHWAAAKGYKEMAELLLASKAEASAKNNTGLTPLDYAALNKHTNIVELLRQHGGQDKTTATKSTVAHAPTTSTSATPIHGAADNSNKTAYEIPAFKSLMSTVNSHMDVTLEQGKGGSINITGELEFLGPSAEDLIKGGTVTLKPKLNEWGPGARHTLKGKLEIQSYKFISDRDNPLVFRVVQNRGYVYESGQGTVTTPAGEKILLRSAKQVALSPEQAKLAESAIHNGNSDIVRGMLDKNAQLVSGTDEYGQTLLHHAAFDGQADIECLLIDRGADINAVNRNGATALFNTALMNTVDAARVLLEKGANVNAVNYDGETPLHRAVISSVEMVKLLIDFGAKVDVKDNEGKTPTDIAVMFEKAEVIKLMKGGLDGAIEAYTKAIKVQPDYFDYLHRGFAKQAKGDLDGGIADYTEAIKLQPDFPQAYDHRGIAKQAKGDLDGAKTDYKKALEIRPGFGEAQKRLDELDKK